MHKQHLDFFLAPTIPVIPMKIAIIPVPKSKIVEIVVGLKESKSKWPLNLAQYIDPEINPAIPINIVMKAKKDKTCFMQLKGRHIIFLFYIFIFL